jgi:CBS domain-containing protein
MRAKDLMRHEVVTVQEDDTVEDLVMVFVGEHIHGAPVVDGEGKLVGIVTQQDCGTS